MVQNVRTPGPGTAAPAAREADGTLVTGRESHQIYVMEGGSKRWIPDLWTMQAAGLSPADLLIVTDDELAAVPYGRPLPSQAPSPHLEEGTVVETEAGAWKVRDGRLVPVDRTHFVGSKDAAGGVVYLPVALLRPMLEDGQEKGSEL